MSKYVDIPKEKLKQLRELSRAEAKRGFARLVARRQKLDREHYQQAKILDDQGGAVRHHAPLPSVAAIEKNPCEVVI